ncbi:DUF2314 domain-containing protein [Mucilaginibacter pedocola]|uniref:DUF2314 domain-containing protein n=1 Tax=Mucilaginibacter pedocola TaxID=1792845 RepID=A0A1S9PAQ5_9SPHI|nr:DUF2314 domain-containing protein [Mucilaginibacter pedocola]OOQ58050.1 hypothetical protein BC343_10330 [Mucilaginibacter pedocola]
MKNILLLLIVLYAPAALCQHRKVKNDTLYKSVHLEKGDRTFLALKDTAQKHLPQFINAVKKFGHDKKYRLVVKSDFVENGEHEHMWSQIYDYEKGTLKGIFIDSPFELKNIKTGQRLSIKATGVEDWAIYNSKGELLGGSFSTKYLESKQQ